MAQLGIGLRHESAREQRAEPQQKSYRRSPQFLRAENQRKGEQAREHHQLTISTHEQVVSIASPPNGDRAKSHDLCWPSANKHRSGPRLGN